VSQYASPAATQTASGAASTVLAVVLIILAIAAYWVPTIIAIARHKDIPNFAGVIVINFLLGWMFIGWVVALVMAVRSKPRPVVFAPGRTRDTRPALRRRSGGRTRSSRTALSQTVGDRDSWPPSLSVIPSA
jgi:hypothetical protein